MVLHYDMATGTVIPDDAVHAVSAHTPPVVEHAEPRLMHVHEETLDRPAQNLPPADIATQPVSTLLAKWR
ncbi:MAG: hypothetical protein H6955_14240 [Chromatiaceae bacterium]|nr:hypothetical protein [Gammaproteobacteria bacterium]MCP5314714.1 hypothetical protein [Chromatiaceae bacterium]